MALWRSANACKALQPIIIIFFNKCGRKSALHNRSCETLRSVHHTWSTPQGVKVAHHLSSPSFSHHHLHLSKQAVRSLVGLQEEGSGCIHSLTMIKTHSEEPFKGPVPIMESLIGAYSARKVFAGGEKKKFQGSNNHFVCCLVYVKFMQRCTPPRFSNSFCCLFF